MTEETFDMEEFEAGSAAFFADDDHLLFACTPSFLAGYKESYLAWACKEYPRATDGDYLDEYWSAHYEEACGGMAGRLFKAISDTKPRKSVANVNLKAIVQSYALGILTAIALGLAFLAPFLMTVEDVAAFWKEVL